MPSFAPQPLAPDARKRAWEVGLPAYLQHDLDAYKKGLAENSTLLDCLWGELAREATVQKIRTVQTEGSRQVVRDLEFFNLDVVISLGYRVNSIRATLFRQWATRVLREMLLNKLDEIKRIGALERRMDAAEGDIKQVQAGVNYLVQQLTTPPPDPPRRKIGFTQSRR